VDIKHCFKKVKKVTTNDKTSREKLEPRVVDNKKLEQALEGDPGRIKNESFIRGILVRTVSFTE